MTGSIARIRAVFAAFLLGSAVSACGYNTNARIIADGCIAGRVPQSEWQGAVDALIEHMKGGRIADGFIVAIDACGKVLAAGRDELPDRIYLV